MTTDAPDASTYLPGWSVSTWTGIRGPATVADLNKDGKNEVVVGIEANPARLLVLSSKGTVLPGWPQTLVNSTNDSSGIYPVVGDLDHDGDLEIACVGSARRARRQNCHYVYGRGDASIDSREL